MDSGLVLLAVALIACLGGQTAVLVSLHRRAAPQVDLAALVALVEGVHASAGRVVEQAAGAVGAAVSASMAPPERSVSEAEAREQVLHDLERSMSTFDPTSDVDPTDGWLPRDRAEAFMAAGGASGAAAFGIGGAPPDVQVEYDPTPDIDGMPGPMEMTDPDGYPG